MAEHNSVEEFVKRAKHDQYRVWNLQNWVPVWDKVKVYLRFKGGNGLKN